MARVMRSEESRYVMGQVIRAYVSASRMTNQEVANLVGCAPGTIGDWINGNNFPSSTKIAILEDVFYGIGEIYADVFERDKAARAAALKESNADDTAEDVVSETTDDAVPAEKPRVEVASVSSGDDGYNYVSAFLTFTRDAADVNGRHYEAAQAFAEKRFGEDWTVDAIASAPTDVVNAFAREWEAVHARTEATVPGSKFKTKNGETGTVKKVDRKAGVFTGVSVSVKIISFDELPLA